MAEVGHGSCVHLTMFGLSLCGVIAKKSVQNVFDFGPAAYVCPKCLNKSAQADAANRAIAARQWSGSERNTGMLVLSRHVDETIVIGDDIEVTVVSIKGDKVRLGIKAPRDIVVHREEVSERIHNQERQRDENRQGKES